MTVPRLVLRARAQHGAAFNHKPGSKGASYFMYFPGIVYILRADQAADHLIPRIPIPYKYRYTKLKPVRLHTSKAETSKFIGGGVMMGSELPHLDLT